jgi:hypothetical protein
MNSLQCARGIVSASTDVFSSTRPVIVQLVWGLGISQVRQEGWRGLFRGLTWTLMRDVVRRRRSRWHQRLFIHFVVSAMFFSCSSASPPSAFTSGRTPG